jgi:hypothetical protein
MRMLILASLVVALGFTSACTTTDSMKSPSYSSTAPKLTNQADCERAGGKGKTVLHHCDMDD